MNFLNILQLMLIAFKLTKVIDWSWWLVLLPFEISVSLYILMLIILLIVGIIGDVRSSK